MPDLTAPLLGEDELHVWYARLDRGEEVCPDPGQVLSGDEQQRAARFLLPRDRQRFAVARSFLRLVLGRYLDAEPGSLRFAYGDQGKPRLADPFSDRGIEFNLSHSGDLVVVALSLERPLGVDVEAIRPELAIEDLARRYFAADEIACLLAQEAGCRREAFFRIWARKEAFLKALGTGLGAGLDTFAVSADPDRPTEVVTLAPSHQPLGAGSWFVYPLRLPAGFVGAVCAAGGSLAIREMGPTPG